jgi:histone H3/H4
MPAYKDRSLSLATIDRIFLKAKCTPADIAANDALGQMLEQIAGEILETARVLNPHAGRKTITDADIDLAYDHWQRKLGLKKAGDTPNYVQ